MLNRLSQRRKEPRLEVSQLARLVLTKEMRSGSP